MWSPVVAAIVGAIVILLFFLGGRTDAVVPDRRIHINFLVWQEWRSGSMRFTGCDY